ncbi:MAG TPA: carboxypeptidase regulatory-like domain-containing protein [Verrucomicrobiae bacterium]|nr:carboxypeptidase regulatory-like domain-containing protein [Verrucomicrobiae bacterium]
MSRVRFQATALFCLALSLLFAFHAFAQSDYGSISGFVKDPSGAIVPKAKVSVKNEATGQITSVTTNDAGYYTATNLQPGYYSVAAEATGFKKYESTHNKLDANSALSLDASLTVGSSTETVEVVATAAALQTESGAVQNLVGSRQVLDQELNGRNPVYMAQFLPGVRGGGTIADFNFASTGGQSWQINGARTWDTVVTFDGAPAVRTRANGAVIGVADVDSTQEIQVMTANYAAEYGRAAGGQIRIVTKSGTSDFHGSLYEYFRNSAMNANTWSRNLSTATNFASPFRYNNFGGTIGGPVWAPGLPNWMRQKFFFFVAEDWVRYRATDTQTQAVPTTLMRQGNFSELLGPNPWYSGSHVIYDPATCPSVGAASCVPFAGNIIPANRLSPNGIAIINAYPGPTPGYLVGTQNWVAQAAHPYNQRKGTISGDILATDKQRISGRRSDASYFEYQPFDQGSGTTGKYFNRPNQTNTVSWTYTISPTLINEARVTFSLDDVYIPVNTALSGFNRSTYGINYPFLFGGKDIPGKIPTVNVPNFYSLAGGPYPSHSTGPIWTGSDSVTKVVGNHTLKFGFSFEYSGENDGDQINVSTVPGGSNNQNGTFTFTDARTGLGATSGIGLANLALGYADSYTEIGPRAYTIWRSHMWEGFAQDSWKVTAKLHVDYGIRFTSIQGFYPLWGNADYFDGNLYNPSQAVTVDRVTGNVILGTGNPYNGVVIPGFSSFPDSATGRVPAATNPICANQSCSSLLAPNLPKSYINTANEWQPRVGIAYQLKAKTVIRAGIGRFTTRMGLLDNIFPGGNSPFQPFVTVANVSVDNPGAALSTSINAPLTITTLNRNLKPPESWNWNATVQQELPHGGILTVGYVGRRGLHAWGVYDINQPTAGALQAAPAGTNVNYLRPYKGFAAIQEEESVVNSMYKAFQVSYTQPMHHGLFITASYTLSRSDDGGSNYRDIFPNTYNTSNMWGPSEYDVRHLFVVSYIYDLPIFRDHSTLKGKMLGGWELSGASQFQTGTPCGIGTNNDFAGVGEFGSFGCGSEGQLWVLNGSPQINTGAFAGPVTNSSSPKYFTANVTQPAAGTFNLQSGVRDSVYQPGIQAWNIGLLKSFNITERTGFQFRAEAYDFINHANFSGPNLNPTSSQFGMVTSKSGLARNLQLSLRFHF